MLDISAFSNALLSGSVSCMSALGAQVATDRSGRVRMYAGDDAVIYPLERRGVRTYALRVPLREDDAKNWPEHYADLAMEPGAIHQFLPENLAILDSDVPDEPELALLYSWVPGETLADVIRFRPSGARLDAIVDSLADLADVLQSSGYAHGDIAPGNVVVRPDNRVVLIDLDRMGQIDGGRVTPRRRPGYRLAESGSGAEAEDAFALLVLMTSVAIVGGTDDLSREVETERGAHAPLVFSSWDLLDPARSELFGQLDKNVTGLPALLLEYLVSACTSPAHKVPLILAEAIHEVRRTPQWSRPQSRAGGGWQPAEGSRPEDHQSSPPPLQAWDDDPWSPASFNAPEAPAPGEATGMTGSWMPSEPSALPGVDEHVERLRAIGLRERPLAGSNRHRQRSEGRRELVASQLKEALATNNREVLVRLAMSGDIAELGDSDRNDLVMVLRALSHDQIARAVERDLDTAIVASVDPDIFAADDDIDEAFRARVALARERDAWIAAVIEAVRQNATDRCVELLTVTPEHGLERLPRGIRRRLERVTGIAALAADVHRAVGQRNVGAVVGAMAMLSAQTGNWAMHVDADDVIAAVGYARIRQRVVDLIESGAMAREDQWLVDCVIATGELGDAARRAGKSQAEVARMLGANHTTPGDTHESA